AQEALKEVNAFQCKANGNFDSATEQAVKTFQQEYEPTHTTHENYQLGGIDGVIDKNTILALDESVVEGWKVPEINPNNMYWPPYNFLAKEGEKEIHVRYTQDV
ncbi:peptidoglycan-binding protein, partial [Vibrio kanaloae]